MEPMVEEQPAVNAEEQVEEDVKPKRSLRVSIKRCDVARPY